MTRRRLLGAAIAGAAGLGVALFARGGKVPSPVAKGQPDVLFAGVRLFDGVRFLDGPRDVLVRGDRVEAVERTIAGSALPRRQGGILFPGFVDAHVHLSFSDPAVVVEGGVTTVLDLGEPIEFAFAPHPPLHVRAAGPLITAPRGYPTTSWGANGYGLEVSSTSEARDGVAMLADRGAAMIKVAIEPSGGPLLAPDVLQAAVDAAHSRRLGVAAHALGVEAVRSALEAGVDTLAHAPVEPLPDDLVAELGARAIAVISTVRAFGGGAAARDNLAALAATGCRVVYGTDLGNGSINPGIDVDELAIISTALGGDERALAAATSVSGALAGYGGRVVAGGPADLVWVPRFDSPADLRRDAEVRVSA